MSFLNLPYHDIPHVPQLSWHTYPICTHYTHYYIILITAHAGNLEERHKWLLYVLLNFFFFSLVSVINHSCSHSVSQYTIKCDTFTGKLCNT